MGLRWPLIRSHSALPSSTSKQKVARFGPGIASGQLPVDRRRCRRHPVLPHPARAESRISHTGREGERYARAPRNLVCNAAWVAVQSSRITAAPGRLSRSAGRSSSASSPSRRAISTASSYWLSEWSPATCCAPQRPESAISHTAPTRSSSDTGERISSVKNAVLEGSATASWTTRSRGLRPLVPTIREVRTKAAVGSMVDSAVSAAALAAPYGVTGHGRSVSR